MQLTLNQLVSLSKAQKWSGKVKTKWHPKPGLFEEGSADEIAVAIKDGHTDLKSAMSALNFYINRAGKNLSEPRKQVLESAKDKLRTLFNAQERHDSDFL